MVVGIRVRVYVLSVHMDRGRHWVPSFTTLFSVTLTEPIQRLATSKPQRSSCLTTPTPSQCPQSRRDFPMGSEVQARVPKLAQQHFCPQAPFCKMPKSHSCLLEHKRMLIITCGNRTGQFTGRWLNFACKPVGCALTVNLHTISPFS